MTTLDLSDVYTSDHVYGPGQGGAVLRCEVHPWEVDVDGTDLPGVIRRAEDHVRDAHAPEVGS